MPPHPAIRARVDEWLNEGPRDIDNRPAWFSSGHDRFLEDKLGLAHKSIMNYFLNDEKIVTSAREALERLAALHHPVKGNAEAREELANKLQETHPPPPYNPPTDLKRRGAIVKPETRTRNRNKPPTLHAACQLHEDDWGDDLTSQPKSIKSVSPKKTQSIRRKPVGSGPRASVSSGKVQDGRVQRQIPSLSPRRSARLHQSPDRGSIRRES